jgi:mTERF domain-containing protein
MRKGTLMEVSSSRVKSAFYRFLHDLGVPSDELGAFITRNPWIFQDDLDDLQVRVNYLESKKFSAEMIARVVIRNPSWLSFRYSLDVIYIYII